MRLKDRSVRVFSLKRSSLSVSLQNSRRGPRGRWCRGCADPHPGKEDLKRKCVCMCARACVRVHTPVCGCNTSHVEAHTTGPLPGLASQAPLSPRDPPGRKDSPEPMTLGGSKGLMPTFVCSFNSAGEGSPPGFPSPASGTCPADGGGTSAVPLSASVSPDLPPSRCHPGPRALGLAGTQPQGSACSVRRLLQWTWCGQFLLPKSTSSAKKMG